MPAMSRESDFGEISTLLELQLKLLGKFPVGTGVLEVVVGVGVDEGGVLRVVVGVGAGVEVTDPGTHCE